MTSARTELLAPAGQPDAGYAALHYGADAVYCGLSRFSARAEAVNFSPEELDAFTAYAHSLTPRRQVYLTLNTLVKQAELAEAAETLLTAAECGVDAVIAQDLGAARLVRERFPSLRLHASTQLAVHSLAGVRAAEKLGFSRVTMARELALEELRHITAEAGIEIEAFIHGTLCYSFSGLCLFSSMQTGRSGNRGRCIYTCREAAETTAGRMHPFSLKDLALGEGACELAAAGAASLKIEGRKKSPLYVAAAVDYYRRLLDGTLPDGETREDTEARLKTIFARPWTRLFFDGRHNPQAADTEVVGHRGAPLGTVLRLTETPSGTGILFTSSLPVERHDGIQADIPGEARPYGFPVDALYIVQGKQRESAFAAPAGSLLAVPLPAGAPRLAPGYPLYLASSQAVKRAYPFFRPKAGACGTVHAVSVDIAVQQTADGAKISCQAASPVPEPLRGFPGPEFAEPLRHGVTEDAPAFPARDAAGAEETAKNAFHRMGGSRLALDGWHFSNPDGLFVRPGDWNRLRRRLAEGLEEKSAALHALAADGLRSLSSPADSRPAPAGEKWSIFTDIPEHLDAFSERDFADITEVITGFGEGTASSVLLRLDALAARAGRDRIRLALPLLLREEAAGAAAETVRRLHDAGWRRWMISGLAGWNLAADLPGADLAADWPLYAMNRLAAAALAGMGFSSITLSPEDDAENLRAMLAETGDAAAVTVYSDLPLFISAACAHAHIGCCPAGKKPGGAAACAAGETSFRLERSGRVSVWPAGCGSIVTGTPFSLAGKIEALREMGASRFRADLRWKPRQPGSAAALWRQVRAGTDPADHSIGNFSRSLL